ncbi:hypothetical protein PS645_00211 [Pseudomonas fluorescens]|uniref:Uncharacterized protein n=1 Tax=Pseudomonas fluorescens TaxID=294 RepID=A0A5E6P9H3_PSEFL|nr:hypothetical protein PS645_00211 [Pseudomonas fluorescens]
MNKCKKTVKQVINMVSLYNRHLTLFVMANEEIIAYFGQLFRFEFKHCTEGVFASRSVQNYRNRSLFISISKRFQSFECIP